MRVAQRHKAGVVPFNEVESRIRHPCPAPRRRVSRVRMAVEHALHHLENRSVALHLLARLEIEHSLPFPGIDDGETHRVTSLFVPHAIRSPWMRIGAWHLGHRLSSQ